MIQSTAESTSFFSLQSRRPWIIATVVLAILALIFMTVMIVYIVLYYGVHKSVDGKDSTKSDKVHVCYNGSLFWR